MEIKEKIYINDYDKIICKNGIVELEPKESELFHYLKLTRKVCSNEELEKITGWYADCMASHVCKINKKLGEVVIKRKHARGYYI